MRGRLDHENSLRNAINLGNKAASQRNLNFKEAEFNGVRLNNEQISAKEIVETYEKHLNHLLEVYGYQKGSDEYEVLKSYLFGTNGERVLSDILSLANWGNGGHYGESSAPLGFDGDLLHVKPKLTLNIDRYNNKKEFFYVLFHEMDHMVFFSHITLHHGNKSWDPQQGKAKVVEYLNREDAQFCSEFFARIHTTNLMLINKENKELIMSLGTGETGHSTGDPRYARSMECATIYEQLISIYREGCMNAVKSGERSLGEAEPEFWKFYTALNKKLLQCTTEQAIRNVLIEACSFTPFESSSS